MLSVDSKVTEDIVSEADETSRESFSRHVARFLVTNLFLFVVSAFSGLENFCKSISFFKSLPTANLTPLVRRIVARSPQFFLSLFFLDSVLKFVVCALERLSATSSSERVALLRIRELYRVSRVEYEDYDSV